MQRKSLTMYGLVMWLSELWKDIIVWQHSALHDQGNNAYNHLIMWTYKIERSNAHVYAALKMHLFIAVFPRTILQYLRTMPTQHRASSDTVKIMCIVHHKPYIAKNQTHLSRDYSCSAWHVCLLLAVSTRVCGCVEFLRRLRIFVVFSYIIDVYKLV